MIGAYVGYPALGYALGSLAGQALFPTQLPATQGPRLGDSQATISQIGSPIPICFGTQVVGGIVIWAGDIREEASTTTVGGKGGPEQEQTTYRYFRSFAVLLCEGEISGVRRIWFNGDLVYSRRPIPNIDPEDLDDYNSFEHVSVMWQQVRNTSVGRNMTVYNGTEDQMPDPTIEAVEGVGNVPAYRGYAYIVFNDLELRAEDGFRMPVSMKFEVFEDGDDNVFPLDYYSNEVLYPWLYTEQSGINSLNNNRVESWTNPSAAGIGEVYGTVGELMASVVTPARGFAVPFAIGRTNGSPLGPSGVSDIYGGDLLADGAWAYVSYAAMIPTVVYPYLDEPVACDPFSAWATPGEVWSFYGGGVRFTTDIPGSADGPIVVPPYDTSGRCTDLFWYLGTGITEIRIERLPSAPIDPCQGLTSFPVPGWGITPDGRLAECGAWTYDAASYKVLQKYEIVSPEKVKYPLNPALPIAHPSANNQQFWEREYNRAVARGQMAPGLVYGVDYPVGQAYAYRKDFDGDWVYTTPVSLASIVARLCQRVNFFDYDVSDLEGKFIIGYTVGRQMICRAGIEPLKSIGFFDTVESGIELKFVTRGKAPVATISRDELGARLAEDARPSQLITQKKQEYELPLMIRVHYQNSDRNFDPDEELSPVRFDTKAESPIDIDIAAAVLPDMAAQIAEVLYRDAWMSRWGHQTQLDVARSALEPTDVILVPVDDRMQRIRITALTEKNINLRALELVRDDDGSYTSTAVGTVTPPMPDDEIIVNGPVELLLLDLPPLLPEHDDAGFYAAARPLIYNGTMRGATITRSRDGGLSYETIASVTNPTPAGVVWLPAGEGPSTVFDEESTLRVELNNGALESRSEIDVLNGANAAAVGVHGRWEIVQFKTATNVAGDIWDLSGLLRGRRGTEHAIGTGAVGDSFVMLSEDSVVRITQAVSDIHQEYLYRASPIGASLNAESIEFTGDGEALKPFSPVHIVGEQDVVSNDWGIEWVRRDRLADDLTIPMSEDVEDYEVDILNGAGDVLRTISVSTPTATYTSSQQLTDFGSVQSEISVRVYQISAQVGRGYPGEATLS